MTVRSSYPRPSWHPAYPLDVEWTVSHLLKYLGEKRPFYVFSKGTCVAGGEGKLLDLKSCEEKLFSVVNAQPDFRVRKFPDGNFLVGFRGPVVGLVSGIFLKDNFEILRKDARLRGYLPGERFLSEEGGDGLELIAGIYARARLFDDVSSLTVAKTWPVPPA